ncbi:MAG: hypothetical protein IT452_04665 [Planctomycetia bacterium]|nr:hypothetical protein [Planctomycetia bacterium]
MVIPIGDENPRSRQPWVSWTFAALVAVTYLLFVAGRRPPGGALGFFLSPVLAPDPVTAAWCVLALLILADNVEDRLGPLFHACLLVGAGWIGAATRAVDPASAHAILGRAVVGFPFAGAAAAATAAAVAYAVLFPLHQIKFFHIFTPRRRHRGLFSLFDSYDSPRSVSDTFYVSAPTGIFIWGLGMLAGAIVGQRTAGELAALFAAALAGTASGLAIRIVGGQPAFPQELEPAAAPARPAWAEPPTEGIASLGPLTVAHAPSPALAAPVQPAYVAPKPLQPPPPFATSGWAVLRETDELYDVGRLGRVAAKYMGVPVADATRRIRQTRGVLARGLERQRAVEMAQAVAAAGVPAFAVSEEATRGLPDAQMAASCGCNANGLEFELGGGRKAHVGWHEVWVIAAARVDEKDQALSLLDTGPDSSQAPAVVARDRITQTTFIDVVTAGPMRFRVARQEAVMSGSGDASSAGFRQFAASCLRHRGAAPVNKGLSVIASRGSWGYLAFDNPASYEEYLWWLLQVIRRRSTPAAPAAAQAAEGSRTSWLE